MKRRGFLALIPTISATPLIASSIIQANDEIKIIKPKDDIVTELGQYQSVEEFIDDVMQLKNIYLSTDNKGGIKGIATNLSINADLHGSKTIDITIVLKDATIQRVV